MYIARTLMLKSVISCSWSNKFVASAIVRKYSVGCSCSAMINVNTAANALR